MQPCLYELFALAKPRLAKAQLGEIMKAASRAVLDHGGVITDLKSFGDQPLAYDIRKPGAKYGEAGMWQLTFAANAKVLADIDHTLRVDERMLRWIVLKRRPFEPLPNPYRVARAAEQVQAPLEAQQQQFQQQQQH
ncbi:hypothetical protein N2152v2_005372 [Parachlorella kessleri]